MRLLQYRGIVLCGLLLLLIGAGFLGAYIKGRLEESDKQGIQTKLKATETKLTECEADQQKAIHDAQFAAEWVQLIDEQLGQSERERKQLKKSYDDSLRVIRAMLPDEAERAIAAYYQRRGR